MTPLPAAGVRPMSAAAAAENCLWRAVCGQMRTHIRWFLRMWTVRGSKSHMPCSTNEINSQAWVECISLSNRTCKAESPRGVSEQESPADAVKPARRKSMQKLLQFDVFRFISTNSISPNCQCIASRGMFTQALGLYCYTQFEIRCLPIIKFLV